MKRDVYEEALPDYLSGFTDAIRAVDAARLKLDQDRLKLERSCLNDDRVQRHLELSERRMERE